METLFIYLVKSSGLIGMFYLAYFLLLRKETFFNSNRWFLLAGLITSVVLPLVVLTKIVWVDPSPTTYDWSKIAVTTVVENDAFEINWYLVFALVYSIGILVFLIKLAFDFYSVSKVLKGKTVQQQADYKFIDLKENVSPFSYFNFIVYNSSLYSETELENILEHEKVHSAQNHTVDVLISRLFCVVFWFNPLVWLYKKAIVQNLEFIADSEASKNISDKKAYQLTLLKITTQENCVAITNHFYQSLIKKRIVMLNKNQSNKRNSWKYLFVLPLLGAFVFFFQVKVIAQEKESPKQEITNIETPVFIAIKKNTTDAQLKKKTTTLKEKYGITLTFSGIERNSENELTAIKVNLKKGKKINNKIAFKGTEAIKTFGIIVSKNENGELSTDFSTDETIIDNSNSVVISPNAPVVSLKKTLFIINGKKTNTTLEELNKTDQDLIESISTWNGKSAIKKYGQEGENGVVEIVTKENADLLKSTSTIPKKEATKLDIILGQQAKTSLATKNSGWELNYGIINSEDNNQKIKKDEIVDYNKPIIIINGKKTILKSEEVNKIDPNLIQTMNVLKEESAIEKYGKDGKNGVIEIITKEKQNNIEKKESYTIAVDAKFSENETYNHINAINNNKEINAKKALILFDGNEISYQDLNKIDIKTISSSGSFAPSHAVKKYGDKGKNGVIFIDTKKYDMERSPILREMYEKENNKVLKKESELDKGEIENSGNETVSSYKQYLEMYKTLMTARFSLERMKIKNEQAKVKLEKAKIALKTKLLS